MTVERTVSLLTLGCARNDVDSEELAARLGSAGWRVTTGTDSAAAPADVVIVNTCGFVAAAKAESVDTILETATTGVPVVAVGCMAERYGRTLAAELPEAAAVVGFDGYENLAETLDRVLAGETVESHRPTDRRELLPISPVRRQGLSTPPGHGGTAPTLDLPSRSTGVLRARLTRGPVAPLKIASGCDRRCSFCAIPRFRGAFVSRRPTDVLNETRWLAAEGVRELVLVSENSTSYGKDLGDPRLLETLLVDLAAVDGIERVRVSYLQPAEMRPSLIEAIAATPGVAAYFDLSFQHASGPLLRRMRRFGDAGSFLDLIRSIRSLAPEAGIRSNVIVGFPGETEAHFAVLEDFVAEAELDAVGVFGYSEEEDTEAARFSDAVDEDVIAARVARISDLTDLVSLGRAERRVGSTGQVLVEEVRPQMASGRTAFQGPEDGDTTVDLDSADVRVGDLIAVTITESAGVDLIANGVGVMGSRP